MRRKTNLARSIIVAGAMALMLTGCGGSDTESKKESQTDVTEVTEIVEENSPEEGEENGINSSELQPFEIKESGYTITGEEGAYYIHYGVVLYNPNKDYYCEYPTFRVTAEDKDGNVLDTEDQTLMFLNGDRTVGYAGQACSMAVVPDKVIIEAVETPQWKNGTAGDLGLTADKVTKSQDTNGWGKVSGKIVNSTDNSYSEVAVSVIFKDESGKITGGETAFVKGISPKGSVPFSIDVDGKYMTNHYEIYCNNWTDTTYDTVIEGSGVTVVEATEATEATTAPTTAATTATTEATTEAATTEKKKKEEATTAKKKKKKKKTKKNRDYYKTDHDYDWYMRNGEGGEKFSYTMTVNQTVEDGIYLCDLGSGYSGKMAFVYVDTSDYTKEITGGKKIIEDDTIRVYGEFVQTYTYTTAIGGSKESIVVKAVYVDIQ